MAQHNSFLDNCKIDYQYDADGTLDGTATTMIDMQGYSGCLVMVFGAATTPSATHCITGFKVVSNTTSAGGGTDHDIAEGVTTDGGTTKTLTNGDFGTAAFTTPSSTFWALDVKAEDIYPGDRYIAAVLAGTGTFTCTVVYLRYGPDNSWKDMFQTTRTCYQYRGNL